MKPGQREVDKLTLAKFIEYTTDRPMDIIIPKDERDLAKQMALCKNDVKLERLVDFFPSDADVDDVDGLYMYIDKRDENDGVWLKRRFVVNDQPRRVPRSFIGPLCFEHNFGLNRAVLREVDGSAQPYHCALLVLCVHILRTG